MKVALVGNPNCGKSTLFNILTGLNQKTGNLPGVTVDSKIGELKLSGKSIRVVDVPGLYSLKARSADEWVSAAIILDQQQTKADHFVYVADATHLRKSLFLFYQMLEAGCPLTLVINFSDKAEKAGFEINTRLMSERLNVEVLTVSGLTLQGINQLKQHLEQLEPLPSTPLHSLNKSHEAIYAEIDQLIRETIKMGDIDALLSKTQQVDRLVLHRYGGFFIFGLILILLFQAVFSLGAAPSNWIEGGFLYLAQQIESNMTPGLLKQLLVNGVLPGLSGVVMFVPQIALLFMFLAILEDSGYMVRASILMDSLMRKAGLNGRGVIPLVSGIACAIPAIMASRTIQSSRERIITMMVIPLMSCSARVPVFVLLIGLLVPNRTWFGVIGYQGMALTVLYAIGFLSAFFIAMLLSKTTFRKKDEDLFFLEVPEYKMPQFKHVMIQMAERSGSFVKEAGKIIFSVSMLLWALSSFGPGHIKGNKSWKETENIDHSFAAAAGKAIEPLIAPLGYDWRLGIAIISSFAAREIFVGTMSTIYQHASGANEEEEIKLLRDKMKDEINPKTGKPMFDTPVVLSLLVFYLFALQCVSTIAVMRKETGNWKWPLFQFAFMGLLAYGLAFAVYQLALLF